MNNETISVPRERALFLVNLLAKVAGAAFWLADNSEDDGSEGINCQRDDFDTLSKALDLCDELPELPGNVVRDGWLRAVDELRALLAQPAEQHQDHSVIAHVCAYTPGLGQVELQLPGNLPSWLELGETVTVRHGNAQHQGEPVYMVRTHGSCCWEEVGSGSLEDFQSMPEEYELRALYTNPGAQLDTGTNSDKYKAELYDEVWQLARDMGFGNVTDALMKLKKQPTPAAVVLPERQCADHFSEKLRDNADGWNACLDEVARLNPPQQ